MRNKIIAAALIALSLVVATGATAQTISPLDSPVATEVQTPEPTRPAPPPDDYEPPRTPTPFIYEEPPPVVIIVRDPPPFSGGGGLVAVVQTAIAPTMTPTPTATIAPFRARGACGELAVFLPIRYVE